MRKFGIILFLALFALTLWNCGSSYDNYANNLYVKSQRANAIAALKKADQEKAFPYVIKVLGSKDDDSVNAAIEVLKSWNRDTTIKKLKDFFITTDNMVITTNIVRSIWKIGGPGAEDFLIKLLHDNRLLVQSEAMIGLGELKSKKALPNILTFLTPENLNNPILPSALIAVQNIGDPSAVPALKKLLASKITSVTLKINIFQTLLKVDPTNAENNCLEKLKTSGNIRMIAVTLDALKKYGTMKSIQPIEDLKKRVNGMDNLINNTVDIIKKGVGNSK